MQISKCFMPIWFEIKHSKFLCISFRTFIIILSMNFMINKLKGQGEEHDKRHFLLSSRKRLKVYKLILCIVFSFITHSKGTSSLFPSLILASCTTHI